MSNDRPLPLSLRLVEWSGRLGARSGLFSMVRRMNADNVTILMYHKVLPTVVASKYPMRNLVVDVPVFAEQMTWLAEHYRVLTVREAMFAFGQDSRSRRLDRRPIACVTFDDGYRDNFDYAAPVLESLELRGTFFVTTGFVEGAPMWFDQAAMAWLHDPVGTKSCGAACAPGFGDAIAAAGSMDSWLGTLKHLPTDIRNRILLGLGAAELTHDGVFSAMSPAQVRSLSGNGHEIAGHSESHPILTDLDNETLRRELELPRATLSQWTGGCVDGLCYPNGDCNERVKRAAVAAGYRYACSVERGIVRAGADPMALPRRAIFWSDRRHNDVANYESEVVGWSDLLRRQQKSLATLRRMRW